MAVGVDTIETTGRLIFDLERNGEKTTKVLEITSPITDAAALQTAVNTANSVFTNAENYMNIFIQPSTWRDDGGTETNWTTTGVRYEQITITTRPIEPDTE